MTYLQITCNECKSVYRAYRVTTKPTNNTHTINFCMYCAATAISIDQLTTEQTWVEYMAEKYHKTPDQIELLLEAFGSLPRNSTINFDTLAGTPSGAPNK